EATSKHWPLFKRRVYRDRGLRNDVSVVYVGRDADDAMRRQNARLFAIGTGYELQNGIRPIDMPIDGVLIGKHALRESLADDDDRLSVLLIVERIKIAARDNGNAERRKESGRYDTPVRAGILNVRGVDVTIGRELHSGARRAVAPGNDRAERGPVDARQCIGAPHHFLVEINHLLRRLPISHGGEHPSPGDLPGPAWP